MTEFWSDTYSDITDTETRQNVIPKRQRRYLTYYLHTEKVIPTPQSKESMHININLWSYTTIYVEWNKQGCQVNGTNFLPNVCCPKNVYDFIVPDSERKT